MSPRSGARTAAAIGTRTGRRFAFLLAAGSVVVSAAAGAADPADGPAAVPYRPSVSTPAALSAPGWLEIEAGLQHDRTGGPARRDGVPLTLKLAFTPDWGLRIGSDGWVRQRDDSGARQSGYGDTGFVVKRRFAVDDAQAFGLEAGASFATARSGLGSGSGKTDLLLNGIYSADIGAWHTDLNLGGTRLGAAPPGASTKQLLWAAALSRGLGERWGVVGELAGAHQSGVPGERQVLLALSYNVSARLVLDVGAARSLRSGPPQWSAFTGFTWVAGRIF